jgi:two-component system response regulator AlgR
METLRAVLVDDEPPAIRRLERALARIEGVEVVGSTTSPSQAVAMIEAVRPDLLFLDVSMPGMSGFDLLERLSPEEQPAVIFVTAHDTHAVHAFDVAAVDYLMKPVAPERLEEAMGRVRLWLHGRAPEAAGPTPARLESLWIHRHRERVRVPVDEIEWIEGYGDYARIHGPRLSGLARITLSALEEQLDPGKFVRVHRSAICRRQSIVSLRRRSTGAMTALLASGEDVPVGRRYLQRLRSQVGSTAVDQRRASRRSTAATA